LIECAVQSIDGADRGIDCFNASEMVALDSAPCEDIRFKITYKMFNKCEDPVSGSNPKNFNQESGYNVAINLNHNKLTVDGVEVGQVETEEKQMIPMFQNAKVRHYIDANSCNNKDYDVSADFRAKRIVGNDKWNIGCKLIMRVLSYSFCFVTHMTHMFNVPFFVSIAIIRCHLQDNFFERVP
jgi:hypothetical protein